MAAERNHFNINLGDTIYSDSEVGGVPAALTVPAKWAKYRRNLSFGHLRNLRRGTGLYSHWDDHEFINDFTLAEHRKPIFRAGASRFHGLRARDVRPQRALPNVPLGQAPRALLPRRALVPVGEGADGVRERSRADRAPAGAQRVRRARACARQTRSRPPASTAIDDPRRTMLGARQYAAFTRAIRASTATWKVIVNEVPIQQFYALPYDRWEGYAAERTSCSGSCRRT